MAGYFGKDKSLSLVGFVDHALGTIGPKVTFPVNHFKLIAVESISYQANISTASVLKTISTTGLAIGSKLLLYGAVIIERTSADGTEYASIKFNGAIGSSVTDTNFGDSVGYSVSQNSRQHPSGIYLSNAITVTNPEVSIRIHAFQGTPTFTVHGGSFGVFEVFQ